MYSVNIFSLAVPRLFHEQNFSRRQVLSLWKIRASDSFPCGLVHETLAFAALLSPHQTSRLQTGWVRSGAGTRNHLSRAVAVKPGFSTKLCMCQVNTVNVSSPHNPCAVWRGSGQGQLTDSMSRSPCQHSLCFWSSLYRRSMLSAQTDCTVWADRDTSPA